MIFKKQRKKIPDKSLNAKSELLSHVSAEETKYHKVGPFFRAGLWLHDAPSDRSATGNRSRPTLQGSIRGHRHGPTSKGGQVPLCLQKTPHIGDNTNLCFIAV